MDEDDGPVILPEPYDPTEEDLAEYDRWLRDHEARRDAMGFPRLKSDADRRQDMDEVRAFFAEHPDA
jgi:hypothetical protein